VTFWNFIAMAAAVAGMLAFLPRAGTAGDFHGFFAMFLVLFVTAGIGNGSTFSMIPAIFREARRRDANAEAAVALGLASAIGAYGGFFIPLIYGVSISMTGAAETALYLFIAFYLTCIAMTWWLYLRRSAGLRV
jgi:NNP family nitrate/nitrite transporter-like MFS transporter